MTSTAVARRIRNSPALRAAAAPTYRAVARSVFFLPSPRVLANSLPKAGTHLLSAVLLRLPKMMFSGVHHSLADFDPKPHALSTDTAAVDWVAIKRRLGRIRNGQYATAHFAHSPVLGGILADLGFRHILILRDPRDVVVSHAFYVASNSRHPLHTDYRAMAGDGERILASITGLAPEAGRPGLEPAGGRLAGFVPWIDQEDVLLCRFEDLAGPRGGGDENAQVETVRAIADFVSRPLSREQAGRVAARIHSEGAATFRKGRSGDWRNYFGRDHVAEFKRIAGDHLVRLGYEKDLNW